MNSVLHDKMKKLFAQHPAGLPYLFLTELWERFGYYLMIGIFVLYMEDTAAGGLGLASASSTDIFGTFIALNYLTPFIGGMLADRLLGYRRAVIIGGILMGLGYCCLAIQGMQFFWFAIFYGSGKWFFQAKYIYFTWKSL